MMLAALHRVEPRDAGLAGEQETSLHDEIARWSRAFETVDETLSARYMEAETILLATMPRALPPVVCHGDYRLGNMLCDRGEVAAIIDWEIWALSDPRLDLAWFVFFTDDAEHPMAMNPGPTGMPRADELLGAYVDESGTEPADLEWFHCLIRYKEAAATSLLVKRMLKANAEGPVDGSWASAIPGLTAECIDRLRRWSPTHAE
jgi:aminoglycoside phosphotransferase (APT) family kinase protein